MALALRTAGARSPRKMWPNLTNDKITKALNKREYIKIAPNKTGKLSLSGAIAMWERKDPNFIYDPNYRLAGNINDIRAFITASPSFEPTFEMVSSGAYSYQNHLQPNIKAVMDAEIAEYKALRQQAKIAAGETEATKMTLDDAVALVKAYGGPAKASALTTGTTAKPGPKVGAGRGRAIDLPRRFTTMLEQNTTELDPQKKKVLDVADLKPDAKGGLVGAHQRPRDKLAKNRVWADNFPFLASRRDDAGLQKYDTALRHFAAAGIIDANEVAAILADFNRKRIVAPVGRLQVVSAIPPTRAPVVTGAVPITRLGAVPGQTLLVG